MKSIFLVFCFNPNTDTITDLVGDCNVFMSIESAMVGAQEWYDDMLFTNSITPKLEWIKEDSQADCWVSGIEGYSFHIVRKEIPIESNK